MLLSLAAMLMVPVHVEDTTADDFAQCAYVAGTRAQSKKSSEEERKGWSAKADTYIDKAMALAHPGKTPTDDDYATMGKRAASLLTAAVKDMDGETARITINAMMMTCALG